MWCWVVLVHLCLPLDAEVVGIKRRVGTVQTKENRERGEAETPYRKQVWSGESPQTVKRTTVKWPEENTIPFFNKHTCDLGSRKGRIM